MTVTTPARRAVLLEQAEILSRLEEIVTDDERRLASDLYEPDRVVDEERYRLLVRFAQLAGGPELGMTPQGAAPQPAAAHGSVGRREATQGCENQDSSQCGAATQASIRDRVRDVERRTTALLVAWRIRQGEINGALDEIREGRRLLASYRASSTGPSGLDISR